MAIFLLEIIYGWLKIISLGIISKASNYREAKTVNWKKYKDNIITGIGNLVEGKLSLKENITKGSLTRWEEAIVEKLNKFSKFKEKNEMI